MEYFSCIIHRYPDVWYDEITSSSQFFSLAATLNRNIIGLLVAEVKTKSLCNKEDAGILSFSFSDDTQVAYILSIGVVNVFRRHGIGTLLLDSFLSHLTTPERENCKAVYLHVLTTNSAAVKFYDKRHFRQFRYLPLYYAIDGTHKDGYSYVLYINGGEPPWTLAYPLKFVDFLEVKV
ncbi:N-alpha-acetyltransferase 60 [Desmophyllum pertusum]|uniref:N-alpha-acetyltransferase 60 n=1 Tax=Desmophyllum pertusum TaxID=174260 RepID=A0A9W9YG28_9CNID|nr:N-alpha-acetyltransferase 60 [Desmophyllum pertusum]